MRDPGRSRVILVGTQTRNPMRITWTAPLLLLALAAVTSVVTSAAASDHLDGRYQLDPKASDDPALLGELVEMNAAMVAIARKMKTKLTIDGEDGQVTVTLETPLGSNDSTYPTDGSTIVLHDPSFGSGEMRVRWEQDGTVLVFESDTAGKNDKPIHNVTRRFLEDPDTLIQQFEVSVDGADPVVIRRVFRRI